MRALKAALGSKPDTYKALGRAILAPPEAAIAAIEGMVVFAGIGRPSSRAAFRPAQFQRIGHRGRCGDTPVKTITSEIGEATTLGQPITHGIQGPQGLVIGVSHG